MIKVKLQGKEVDFPTCVADLTLKQFFALRQATTPIEEVCALTGLDKATISNFKDISTMHKAQALMKCIEEDMKAGFGGGPIPERVFMQGRFVVIPKDLKLQPVGAWMNVHDLLAEQSKVNEIKGNEDFTDCIPKTLAHYLYLPCHPGKEYSEEAVEAPDWMAAVMSLHINIAIPIANAFFLRFPNLL